MEQETRLIGPPAGAARGKRDDPERRLPMDQWKAEETRDSKLSKRRRRRIAQILDRVMKEGAPIAAHLPGERFAGQGNGPSGSIWLITWLIDPAKGGQRQLLPVIERIPFVSSQANETSQLMKANMKHLVRVFGPDKILRRFC